MTYGVRRTRSDEASWMDRWAVVNADTPTKALRKTWTRCGAVRLARRWAAQDARARKVERISA